ncbi:cytochrome b5-related protein [Armadillidium vulgare]|nr:cytochrome b5-related protein [Armadillidium vulgare]
MAPNSENVSEIGGLDKDLVLTSGIRKYPTNRNSYLKNPDLWLQGKKEDDNVYPYWRLHDKLYDLTAFIKSHPGGPFWIEETRGTDITESFESSHFRTLPEQVTPILKRVGTGPSLYMKLMQDTLLFGFLVFSILAARNFNIFYAIIAGILFNFMANVAHNFFHQKDNWRMLIFDLTLNSSREWRISHALSHHNYPNTIIDYEVSALEPHFELLPKSNKSFLHRYAAIVTGSILYSIAIYSAFVYRVILYKMGKTKFYKEDILPFLHLLLIIGLCGSVIQGLQ